MTIDIFKVPQAEMDLLDILWESEKPMITAELAETLLARTGKCVKPSTINTLAARLTKKGLILYVQAHGQNLYLPLMRKEDYQFFVAKRFLDTLFHGSVVELVSTLLMDMDLSREALDALKSLVASAALPGSELESQRELNEKKECISVYIRAVFLPCFKTELFPKETLCPVPADSSKKKRRRTDCVPRAS